MLNTNFWKKYFRDYDVLNVLIPYQELKNEIIKNLEIKNGEKILDLGSGTGNIAVEIKKLGAEVVGIDFSVEGVKRHKEKDPDAEVLVGDISQELPFQDSAFDKVYSNNGIYTIDPSKRSAIFDEVYRVLKPGGRIVVSNITKDFKPFGIYKDHLKKQVGREGLANTLLLVIKLAPATLRMFYYNFLIKKENKGGSYGFFVAGEQKNLLEKSGFKDISNDIYTYSNQAILNKATK